MQPKKSDGIGGVETAGELIDRLWGNGAPGAKRRGAMTFWDDCDSFPPILCRLLARQEHGRPLTTAEIEDNSGGLSPAMVEAMSRSTSWKGVKLDEMRAFLKGCNLDFCDTKTKRRTLDYLRKMTLRKTTLIPYLQKSGKLYCTYYLPLLKLWCQSYGIVTKDSPIHEPVRALLIQVKQWFAEQDKPLSQRVPEITAAPEFP